MSHNNNDEKCKKAAPVAEVKGRVGRRGAFELLVNGQMVRVSFHIHHDKVDHHDNFDGPHSLLK